MYLLDLEAYDIAAGAVTTLRYSSGGLTTPPDDTPPNAYYAPLLAIPASFEVSVFKDGVTGGAGDISLGEIELVAVSGGLDTLAGYALDGRRFVLRHAAHGRVDTAETVMTGVVESLELTWTRAILNIRDRRAELEKPIQANLYAGTDSGPDGVEGDDNLKGDEKPLCYGHCCNAPTTKVNASTLIYQIHDGPVAAIEAVYDKGLPLTATQDYADVASLQAATFSAGQFATCLSAGMFRLWAKPAGAVTADVRGDASGGYVSTVAGIMERILRTRAGYGSTDLSAADFAALAAANPAEVGLCIDAGDGADMDQVLDDLARSIGAWWTLDRFGVVRVGRFEAPAGEPVATLTEVEILAGDGGGVEQIPANDTGNGVPVHRVSLTYGRNWSVQDDNDLAGAVEDDRRAWLAEKTRTVVAEDAAVLDIHPLSPAIDIDTLLVEAAAANNEADRLLALYKVRRQRFRVRLRPRYGLPLSLGNVVRLTLPRFGLSAGKLFAVLGLALDFEDGYVEADLYG
ncbi:hypothetical protein K9F62_09935 [Desulfovibrio sp. JY]|nr:hypothetical protein K9F62_09935 [Desulfovibrio sp. JY]